MQWKLINTTKYYQLIGEVNSSKLVAGILSRAAAAKYTYALESGGLVGGLLSCCLASLLVVVLHERGNFFDFCFLFFFNLKKGAL